jgi:hypothetical protein
VRAARNISLALIVSSAALAAPAGSAERAPAAVRVADCARGVLPADRSAQYRGAMNSVPGTDRMGMRFTLQERVGTGRYATIEAPGLGVWRTSRSGVARFVHRQRVLELATAASYRMRVNFRWYDAGGEVVRRATRRSGGCRQRGRLPDLRVERIAARRLDGAPGATRYVVHVENAGAGSSEAGVVRFAVDGATVDTLAVPPLRPGQRRRVFVTGPDCAAAVRAEVDPDDAVRESSERNNVRAGRCPEPR